MNINKKNIIHWIIIALCFSPFFLPKHTFMFFPHRVNYIICISLFIVFFVLMIFEAYKYIIEKQFTSTIYIVITDVIKIAAFAALFYSAFFNSYTSDIQVIIKRDNEFTAALFFFCGAIMMRYFFRGDEFRRR